MTKITVSEQFGREVTATELIQKGMIVEYCELLVFNPEETNVVNSTDLKYYTFKYDETRDCLCLGNGEIFNHSDTPNVEYNLKSVGTRKVMQFKALKNIEVGEQLFIDYNYDTNVQTNEYVNKNMI